MAQGLVTTTTPVELVVEKERSTIKLRDRQKTIKWDNRLLDENQSKVLLEFIEFVYRAGFSDGAVIALNNPSQPAGNFLLRERNYDVVHGNICIQPLQVNTCMPPPAVYICKTIPTDYEEQSHKE
jgi:ribosomal protein L4